MIGRFAPSPTGQLHVGNLRTALASYASSIAQGGEFLIRMEDLDRVTSSRAHGDAQLHDLRAIGITCAIEPVWQSERFSLYEDAIQTLVQQGLTYECFCTRREIAEAAAAPHGQVPVYPGTCLHLSDKERAEKSAIRKGSLRLRGGGTEEFLDAVHGLVRADVDDVVLRRNDGIPAYNVAVVVDDALQNISEVVRGEDLLQITATQIRLQKLLHLPTLTYAHVPLVLNHDGERLAKRHGAATLTELEAMGVSPADVVQELWQSLGQDGDVRRLAMGDAGGDATGLTSESVDDATRPDSESGDILRSFNWDAVAREPWVSAWSHGKS